MLKNITINKKISVKQYHQIAKDISGKFDLYLISHIQDKKDSEKLLFLYKKFYEKRIGKEHMLPMLVYIASEFFSIKTDKNYSNLIPLMVMPELVLWWSYGLDWVIDQENMDSYDEAPKILMASQYLFSEFLDVNLHLSEKILRSYVTLLRTAMDSFWVDGFKLKITDYKKMEDPNKFWKNYNIRNMSAMGAWASFCFELVAQYFKCDISEKKMAKITKMMTRFGACIQVINDVSDFMIPNPSLTTSEKRPIKDYFADIRDNRLTYPIWLLLNISKKDNIKLHREIIESAKSKRYDTAFQKRVFVFVQKKGIMNEIFMYLKNENRKMRKEINKLDVNNRGADLLKVLSIIITNNKFLRQIKNDYDL